MAGGENASLAHGLEMDNKRENRYSLHRIYSIEEYGGACGQIRCNANVRSVG